MTRKMVIRATPFRYEKGERQQEVRRVGRSTAEEEEEGEKEEER